MNTKAIGLCAAAALIMGSLSTAAMARRGADDPADHVRGEGKGHATLVTKDTLMQLVRRGADDGANHDNNDDRGNDNDDGPNHA